MLRSTSVVITTTGALPLTLLSPVSSPTVSASYLRLSGTDGPMRGGARAGQRAHDHRGSAPRARPLGTVAAVRVRAATGVDLLERLVATATGAVPKRLAHRWPPARLGAPFARRLPLSLPRRLV